MASSRRRVADWLQDQAHVHPAPPSLPPSRHDEDNSSSSSSSDLATPEDRYRPRYRDQNYPLGQRRDYTHFSGQHHHQRSQSTVRRVSRPPQLPRLKTGSLEDLRSAYNSYSPPVTNPQSALTYSVPSSATYVYPINTNVPRAGPVFYATPSPISASSPTYIAGPQVVSPIQYYHPQAYPIYTNIQSVKPNSPDYLTPTRQTKGSSRREHHHHSDRTNSKSSERHTEHRSTHQSEVKPPLFKRLLGFPSHKKLNKVKTHSSQEHASRQKVYYYSY